MFKSIIQRHIFRIFLLLVLSYFALADFALNGDGLSYAGAFRYHIVGSGEDADMEKTVVGFMRSHTVAGGETLLDIARDYGLGFNDLQLLHPQIDPWIPPAGLHITIPTQWILPPTRYQEIVVNLPECRMYRFFPQFEMVKTYPIGIGELDWQTPEGIFRIVDRQEDPVWDVPLALREKYGVARIPPGSDNPLGKYWIGLSLKGYGIHGTNFPWGVGRLVSHGCIRLYPEHISNLYHQVSVFTHVEIIYEPVKIGMKDMDIYLEVHPDVYNKIKDLETYTLKRLEELNLTDCISMLDVKRALKDQSGVPVRIGSKKKGGAKTLTQHLNGTYHLITFHN
ncbi:MAG: L,D-transpeptidase family protein [Desulfobacterales bacterium]|nr:L,D-transpeptidase family protein [Desulfobacterales bacterium]